MAHHLKRTVWSVVAVLLVASRAGLGQCVADSTNYTLEDALSRLERRAIAIKLDSADPSAARALDTLARAIRLAGAGPVSIKSMVSLKTGQRARFADVARWEPSAVTAASQSWLRDAFDSLRVVANGNIRVAMQEAKVDADSSRYTLAPTLAFSRMLRNCATVTATAKMQRYEMKYGKDSPKLNAAEVALNYLLQFAAKNTDGPSRYEIVAAYRTMELAVGDTTSGNDVASVVTAVQFGVRVYNWNPDWGTGSAISRLVKPRHVSFGAYAMDPRASPLRDFRNVQARPGVFVGWGDVHVAYVFRGGNRVLVGTGKQLVPYAF